MGNFISLEATSIKPSQDFLKEKTVKYIFECIAAGDTDSLPPAPIVRRSNSDGEYIAIDGHNLLAVNDFLGKSCEVYVADSAYDKLTTANSAEALEARNNDLHDKYDSAYLEFIRLSREGLNSFSQLRDKYPLLFDSAK